jgi:hypothetical protein
MDGELNSVFLPEDSKILRQPISPEIPRSDQFMAEFDQRGIFYSVFRDISGKRVWFLGPKLMNLGDTLLPISVEGCQSGKQVPMRFVKNVSACVGFVDLPNFDEEVRISLNGYCVNVKVGENFSSCFEHSRILYCINKDNKLQWIKDWAHFYVKEHRADTLVVFENNSENYSEKQIETELRKVTGLKNLLVIKWPFKFGALDAIAQKQGLPFHIMFAQPVMHLELYLRYGQYSRSILNVDVDELVVSQSRKSIFEFVEQRLFGCVKFERFLIENLTEVAVANPSFADFVFRAKSNLGKQDRFKKWAFAPQKIMRRSKTALPRTHAVDGIMNPYGPKRDFKCYHFAGITCDWRREDDSAVKREWQHTRSNRLEFDQNQHVKDEFLAEVLHEVFDEQTEEAVQ